MAFVAELPRELEDRMNALEALDNSPASIEQLVNIVNRLKTHNNTKPDNRRFVNQFISYLQLFILNFLEISSTTAESRIGNNELNRFIELKDKIFKIINSIREKGHYIDKNSPLLKIINYIYEIGLPTNDTKKMVSDLIGINDKLDIAKKDYLLFQKIQNHEQLTATDRIGLQTAITRLKVFLRRGNITRVIPVQEINTTNSQARIDSIQAQKTEKLGQIRVALSDDHVIKNIRNPQSPDTPLKATFLENLLDIYDKVFLLYNNIYLSGEQFMLIPSSSGLLKDYKPHIYALFYSVKMLINLVTDITLGTNGKTIDENKDLIDKISVYDRASATESFVYPEINGQPGQPDNDKRRDMVAAYNSLTDFYDKYIKPHTVKYPGLEDNADIMYTRSHFYPAIKAMYDSLPTVGFFGFVTRKRGVPGPRQNGGLRYARRRQQN